VSLDAWEKSALNAIANDLTAAAPEFASRLSIFNQLTCGERMPEDQLARDKGGRGRRRARPHLRCPRQRRPRDGKPRSLMSAPDMGAWPVVLVAIVMLVATAAIIAVALALSVTSQAPGRSRQAGQCAGSWPTACQRP
jgi:hypothetical protein